MTSLQQFADDSFLLLCFFAVMMAVLAIALIGEKIYNYFHDRKNNRATMARFVSYREYQKRGK
jgi:uncharacterized protein HemY